MKTITSVLFALAAAAAAVADDACCEESACCDESACSEVSLVASYVGVAGALAADDLDTAKAGAAKLACWAECHENTSLAAGAKEVSVAASLAYARAAFKSVSVAAIEAAESEGGYFIMTCPMAKADWIQTDAKVANPYYGSQMLRCGSVKKQVKPHS